MSTTEEKKIEILYDHYKDTFQIQLTYIENRNRYFIALIIIIFVIFFQMVYPAFAEELLRNWSHKQVDFTNFIDFSFIRTILLFVFLWIIVLYLQSNITIERQYKYIHALETDISTQLLPMQITREGISYKKNFYLTSWLIQKIYKYVFPSCILAICIIKITDEYKTGGPFYIFNIGICIIVFTLIFFYIFKFKK